MQNNEKELRQITKYFGIETELTKLNEEVGELLNECYKRHFVDPEYGNVEDELADVMVILQQIKLYFGADDKTINDIMNSKIKRTNERIKSGWYEKHR